MELEQNRQRNVIQYLADTYENAKEYGSILDVRKLDLEFLEQRLDEVKNSVARDLLEVPYRDMILEKLPVIILQANIMGKKYDVVCTNPPYMGRQGMNPKLVNYVDKTFADSKKDLFAVFIERCIESSFQNGFVSMLTQHSWMFLSSFEKLRAKIINNISIDSMNHLGPRAFEEIGGEVVQSTAFVLRNHFIQSFIGTYVRLVDYKSSDIKELEFKNRLNKYNATKKSFDKLPGFPIAYWLKENLLNAFEFNKTVSNYFEVRNGITTGENERFIMRGQRLPKTIFLNSNLMKNILIVSF